MVCFSPLPASPEKTIAFLSVCLFHFILPHFFMRLRKNMKLAEKLQYVKQQIAFASSGSVNSQLTTLGGRVGLQLGSNFYIKNI